MSADHRLALRKALIAGLAADAGITAAGHNGVFQFVESGTNKPYIVYGPASVSPFDPQCVSGGAISGSVSVMTQAEYGSLKADTITAAIFAYLTSIMDAKPALETGELMSLIVENSVVFEDPDEEGAWQGVVTFNALTGQDP